ncbi:MAG: RusA family crossover junction endodeoxyribonuclease, partial [Gammaproteobacteria bacterium]|nr:RusA family crossover junction endodeoxyribonuclease [Gammaproteobacteria bacterium]
MIINLDYPPSTNRIWRLSGRRAYKPAAVVEWMQASAYRALAAGIRPLVGDVHISVILHPKLTKAGKPSRNRMDLDNSLKATLDALEGVAFCDDKQVIRLSASVGEPVVGGGLTVG